MRVFYIDLPAVTSSYPEGVLADALEAQIAKTLPEVEGLDQAMSQADRISVMGMAVAKQRVAFIETYGDPFGCERRSEVREESLVTFPAAFSFDLSLR
jgi:hypothetical protein